MKLFIRWVTILTVLIGLTVPAVHAGIWESESEGGSTGEWGEATEVTLSVAGIAVLSGPGYYKIDTYAAAVTDDMIQITGLAEGDEAIIMPLNDGRTVVAKNGVNMILCREMDFNLNNTGDRMLIQGTGSSVTVELSRSSGGD